MSKIYNEIIIDMNPESPTFEETLYEDYEEYSGDMTLAQGEGEEVWQQFTNGNWGLFTVVDGKWRMSRSQSNAPPEGATIAPEGTEQLITLTGKKAEDTLSLDTAITGSDTGDGDDGDDEDPPDPGSIEWGAAEISKDDFIDSEGNQLSIQEVYNTLDAKLPGITGKDLYDYINEVMPKYQGPDKKELEFLADQEALDKSAAGAAYKQAGDVYDLGAGAAGRDKAALLEQYGLGTSAAERVRAQAGDVYGAAQETYELGKRAAGRQKEAGLGQLQAQAMQAGPQKGRKGAYMAQRTLAGGLGQTYGAFTDTQAALTGARGRAESAYGRAGEAYGDELTRLGGLKERGLGAYEAEMTRLGQAKGAAFRGMEADIAQSALTRERSEYGLTSAAEEGYERDVAGGFQEGWTSPTKTAMAKEDFTETSEFGSWMRKGGRVPSKETFLDILTKLPDAGGS